MSAETTRERMAKLVSAAYVEGTTHDRFLTKVALLLAESVDAANADLRLRVERLEAEKR